MHVYRHHVAPGWAETAGYGAEAGAALALLYTFAFIGYAMARTLLALLATPDVDGGLPATIFATWLGLALPALGLGLICALPATGMGALTALLLRALVSGMGAVGRPGRGLIVGGGACVALSLGLLGLLFGPLHLPWAPATAAALSFWLLAPLVLYSGAGGLAGWHIARARSQRVPQRARTPYRRPGSHLRVVAARRGRSARASFMVQAA